MLGSCFIAANILQFRNKFYHFVFSCNFLECKYFRVFFFKCIHLKIDFPVFKIKRLGLDWERNPGK